MVGHLNCILYRKQYIAEATMWQKVIKHVLLGQMNKETSVTPS